MDMRYILGQFMCPMQALFSKGRTVSKYTNFIFGIFLASCLTLPAFGATEESQDLATAKEMLTGNPYVLFPQADEPVAHSAGISAAAAAAAAMPPLLESHAVSDRAPDALISLEEVVAKARADRIARSLLGRYLAEVTPALGEEAIIRVTETMLKFEGENQRAFLALINTALLQGMTIFSCVSLVEALGSKRDYREALDCLNAASTIFASVKIDEDVNYRVDLIYAMGTIPKEKYKSFVEQVSCLRIEEMSMQSRRDVFFALGELFGRLHFDEKRFQSIITGLLMTIHKIKDRYIDWTIDDWACFMSTEIATVVLAA